MYGRTDCAIEGAISQDASTTPTSSPEARGTSQASSVGSQGPHGTANAAGEIITATEDNVEATGEAQADAPRAEAAISGTYCMLADPMEETE